MWPEKTLALNPIWFSSYSMLGFNFIFLWYGHKQIFPVFFNEHEWKSTEINGHLSIKLKRLWIRILRKSKIYNSHLKTQRSVSTPLNLRLISLDNNPQTDCSHYHNDRKLAYFLWGSVGVTGGYLHYSLEWVSGSRLWSFYTAPSHRCSGTTGCPHPGDHTPSLPIPATGVHGLCSIT